MALATPLLRCLIALLVDTGLRINCEAMKLTWKDVDFEKSQLVVRESKTLEQSPHRLLSIRWVCRRCRKSMLRDEEMNPQIEHLEDGTWKNDLLVNTD